eukprot:g10829.t1
MHLSHTSLLVSHQPENKCTYPIVTRKHISHPREKSGLNGKNREMQKVEWPSQCHFRVVFLEKTWQAQRKVVNQEQTSSQLKSATIMTALLTAPKMGLADISANNSRDSSQRFKSVLPPFSSSVPEEFLNFRPSTNPSAWRPGTNWATMQDTVDSFHPSQFVVAVAKERTSDRPMYKQVQQPSRFISSTASSFSSPSSPTQCTSVLQLSQTQPQHSSASQRIQTQAQLWSQPQRAQQRPAQQQQQVEQEQQPLQAQVQWSRTQRSQHQQQQEQELIQGGQQLPQITLARSINAESGLTAASLAGGSKPRLNDSRSKTSTATGAIDSALLNNPVLLQCLNNPAFTRLLVESVQGGTGSSPRGEHVVQMGSAATEKRRGRKPKTSTLVVRPFVCPEPNCGYSFPTHFSLKRHLKRHNGQKPFQCTFYDPQTQERCSMSFSEKSTLKRHLQMHTGRRPYCCEFPGCTRRFADRVNLQRHVEKHSPEFPASMPGNAVYLNQMLSPVEARIVPTMATMASLVELPGERNPSPGPSAGTMASGVDNNSGTMVSGTDSPAGTMASVDGTASTMASIGVLRKPSALETD